VKQVHARSDRRHPLATAGLYVGGACLAYAAYTWWSYGRRHPSDGRGDPLLDEVMPRFDVAERHAIDVAAPASEAFRALGEVDFMGSSLVRGIVRTREALLGVGGGPPLPDAGLLTQMQTLGWRVLLEEPGRAVAVGTVTRPWQGNVVFRPLDLAGFKAFAEPDYVKIAWTLRVEPIANGRSRVSTETRVATTDASARRRFRRYWLLFSPGIRLIRLALLGDVRRLAERRGA